MGLPSVSVITVSYQSARTIKTTIESVLKQTYPPKEYFIIDGNSVDETVQIAEGYRDALEAKGIRYEIVSEPDKGIYDAMNKGIRKATGDLVGIINSDDWYEENCLQRVAETYEQTPFDMFYADLQILSEDGAGNCHPYMVKRSRYRTPVVSRDWNHPTTFITRKVYDRFQYKLESVHDDWDLVLRIRKAGYKVVVLNEVLANFRMGGASNDKDIRKCVARGKARYRIYRNNGYSRWYWFECVAIEAVKYLLIRR
ncbi:MAG: glycosyltransferase [Lachnospiraceae bacterium]|nr:glycosyltransferase [Lachnospiraceae bacterium]